MKHARPIDQARSSDLRGSVAAMARAAQRAREVAAKTQTAIVVRRNGSWNGSMTSHPLPHRSRHSTRT